jgi:hypothetical protein
MNGMMRTNAKATPSDFICSSSIKKLEFGNLTMPLDSKLFLPWGGESIMRLGLAGSLPIQEKPVRYMYTFITAFRYIERSDIRREFTGMLYPCIREICLPCAATTCIIMDWIRFRLNQNEYRDDSITINKLFQL